MGEIVNLNRARKARAAADRKAEAEANRLKHGLKKAEKSRNAAENSLMKDKLDAHRRDRDDDGGDEPA